MSPLFTAIPLTGKRKYSPFKSPLMKIKIPKSPAVRKSPMTKRLKVTSARALFKAEADVPIPDQSIKEETFDLIDIQNSCQDLCGSGVDNFSERT